MDKFESLISKAKRAGIPVVVLSSLALGAYATLPRAADAETAHTECYLIAVDTPYADITSTEKNTWCYRSERDGSRFIYSVDSNGGLRPELTVAVRTDGTVRHASLNAGKLTLHNFIPTDKWNPIGIPLDPQDIENPQKVPEPVHVMSANGSDGLIEIMELVGGVPGVEDEDLPFKAKISAGHFESQAGYLPWKSFWFPQGSGRLHNGSDSPMAKYDRFVKRRIGVSPEAQSWEKRVHPPREYKWAGHCNGWSASSIMRAEPTAPINDPFSGVTFSIADQKGLWMEVDYCPRYAFFGKRGEGGGNDGDIRAVDFHNVVEYYLGTLKKPVIMDLMSSKPVENRVVSGYVMDVEKVKEDVYRVATKLTIHSYDGHPNEDVGPAGVFTRVYKYMIQVNENGEAIKGKWLSRHPDFFWVPLAPAECKNKNPVVHEAWLKELNRVSQRDSAKPLAPAYGVMPTEGAAEYVDLRPPGAAPLPNATPPPADRQPDEEG